MFNHATGRKTKAEIMGDAPAVSSRFIARNTVEWKSADGSRYIRLHETDILSFHADGRISVYTGGLYTVTTRGRLNSFAPDGFRFWTHKGVLHCSAPGKASAVPFRERLEIGKRGALRSDTGPDNGRAERDRRLIDSYMAKLRRMGEIPRPDGGDPWISPDPKTGKFPESIVRDWLREKYVFGSLSVAAGRYAGLTDTGIAWLMFNGSDATTRRRIRRYLRACLGYCA